jgi:hypothetical protein
MAFFDKWFGKNLLSSARQAELRGDWSRAIDLFARAGEPAEAARVLLLSAEAERDPSARLRLLARAGALAPETSPLKADARKRSAQLRIALAEGAAISAITRHELREAAIELEQIGEPLLAAEAFARAGDREGEARALQAAGEVERLELLLSVEQFAEREQRSREARFQDIDLLLGTGRRREALAALRAAAMTSPTDFLVSQRVTALEARRVLGPQVRLEARGELWNLMFGEELTIGRTEGTLRVPSHAISRLHLRIWREQGDFVVQDLKSRNGTLVRGMALSGILPIGDGLELLLGGEVPLKLAPSTSIPETLELECAKTRYLANFGSGATPVEGLRLIAGEDGWIELAESSEPAFLGSVELTSHATFLVGDAISTERGAPPCLRFASE